MRTTTSRRSGIPRPFAGAAAGLVLLLALPTSTGAVAAELGQMGPRTTYARTELVVDGRSLAIIVVPDDADHEALGNRIAAAIEAKTGATTPVRRSSAVTDRSFHLADIHRQSHLIVLGHAANNVAHLALYANLQALADPGWPAGDGFELRTAANPFFTGRNCIVLGSPTLAGVRAATDLLLARLTEQPDGPALAVPRWCTVFGGGQDQAEAEVTVPPDAQGIRDGQNQFNSAWRRYQETGSPKLQAYLEKCLRRIADGKAGWEHYWGPVLIDPLEFASHGGLADGATLARVDNWLLQAVEKGRDYSLSLGPHEGRYGNRHQTYGTYGFFRSWQYLLHGNPDAAARSYLEPLVEGTRQYLDSLMATYREDDEDPPSYDSTGIFVRHAAGSGRFDWWTGGQGRLCALRGLFCRDNLGYFCGSGGAGWSPPELRARIAVEPAVATATFFDADAELAWFGYRGGSLWTVALPQWNPPASLAARPPSGLLGAQVLPVSRPHWERLVQDRSEARRPYERCFEKRQFRAGFEAQDQYLLVNGLDTGSDTNAIVRYTDRGHIFLFQNQKSENHFHRNALYVSRGLDEAVPPPLAELRARVSAPGLSMAVTGLADYQGADWQRSIIQRHGRYFVVIDQCRVQAEGVYAMAGHWRCPASGRLEGRRWTVRAGLDAFVLECARGATLTLEPIKDRPFAEFEQGSGFLLRQDHSGPRFVGQTTTLLNLLYTTGPGPGAGYDLRAVGEQAALVRDRAAPEDIALVGVGALAGAGFDLDAEVFYVSGQARCAAGERQMRLPPDPAAALADWWDRAGAERTPVRPPRAMPTAAQAAPPLWQAAVTRIRPAPLVDVTVTSDRPLNRGTPDDLLDGQMPMYFNLQTAWDAGTVLTFDLGAVQEIAEVELRFLSGAQAGEQVSLALSNDGFAADHRAVPADCRGGVFYQVPWNAYDYGRFEAAVVPIRQQARQVRMTLRGADSGAEILFGRAGAPRARPRSLQVHDLDGDGRPEIVVATEHDELALFSADGRRLWSRPLDAWITRVLVADLERDGRAEVLVSTFDSDLYAFNADGTERFHWHRDVGVSEFGTVGLWKRDEAGRAQVLGPGYVDFTVLDAAGQLMASSETGGVRNDAALASGADLSGDGVDDQVIHGYYTNNLFVLDGSTLSQARSIQVPIGAALGVELYERGADGARVLCVTTGGVVMAWIGKVAGSETAPIADTSGLGRPSVAAASADVRAQWRHPLGPINAYALLTQEEGPPRIAIAKRDGLLTLLDAEGRLLAQAQLGSSIRSLAASGAGPDARLAAATAEGVVVLDQQLAECSRLSVPECGAVGWLAEQGRQLLVTMTDQGTVGVHAAP